MSFYGVHKDEPADNYSEPPQTPNDTLAGEVQEEGTAKEKVSETLIFSEGIPLSETIEGQTPIQNRWCFWYTKKSNKYESYEQNIKPIQSFGTVEGFWQVYNHMARPADLPTAVDLNLFKEGTKPMWEDVNNKRGGKWVVRLKKGLASRYWEELLLAMVGEQFDVGNEICGAVISIRFSEDMLAIWNRNADNQEALIKIRYEGMPDEGRSKELTVLVMRRDQLRRVCKFPHWVNMEYKRHDQSMGGGPPVPPSSSSNSLPTDGSNSTSQSATYSRVGSSTFSRPLNRTRGSFTSRDRDERGGVGGLGDFHRSRGEHQEGGERSMERKSSPLRPMGSSERLGSDRGPWSRGSKWGDR